jgi:hypothetical protein
VIDATEYLRYLKALLALENQVTCLNIIREESQGDSGLFRYRLDLQDGSLLEIFERFHVEAGNVTVTKYSYHWQSSDGALLKRWDNAPHHPEIATHPHHVHLRSGEVLSRQVFNVEELLSTVSAEIQEHKTKD